MTPVTRYGVETVEGKHEHSDGDWCRSEDVEALEAGLNRKRGDKLFIIWEYSTNIRRMHLYSVFLDKELRDERFKELEDTKSVIWSPYFHYISGDIPISTRKELP